MTAILDTVLPVVVGGIIGAVFTWIRWQAVVANRDETVTALRLENDVLWKRVTEAEV